MSVDPWLWGVDENSDQDWNNGWSNPEFQHNNKAVGSFGGNSGTYSGTNNNNQPANTHPSNQRHSGWAPPNQSHAPPNTTADYFSSKAPPPLNNNTFLEVENKEIAPPDHQHSASSRQPMKLGSKQGQHSGTRGVVATQDPGSHFGNVQHGRNVPPPPFAHPPENHHQQPAPSYFNTHQNTSSRNQSHHYFTDNRKNLFQTDDSNSWSYFDQVGGPMSMPPQQASAPPITSDQPRSLPPEHSDPIPSNLFQDQHNRPQQQEPQNINYFQMQDKMKNFQNFSSNEMPPPQEALDSHRSPKHELTDREPPLISSDSVGVQVMQKPIAPPEKDKFAEHSVDNFSKNTFDDRAQSYNQSKSTQRDYSQQSKEAPKASTFKDEIMERFGPQGFEENPDYHGSQEWNRMLPPPPQPLPVEIDRPDSRGRKFSGPQPQVLDDRTGSQERSGPVPPQLERPMSREWPSSQPPSDRPTYREWSAPPSSQFERHVSRDHSVPLTQVQPEKVGSQEWRGSQLSQGERPGSQGRERSEPYPPDQSVLIEKIGHQRTGSLGSDRSGSLGRDRSCSDRSGSSRNMTHRSDPTSPRNEPTSSRSEHRAEPSGPRPDPPGPRNDLHRPHNDKTMHRSNPPGPQMDGGTVPRPDRVPSRSPGAGEDRSSPPSRPDNLESLPPESHITQSMNQLSLQPKDQMGDCPLDRNEYMETSQLSNQESVETDMRSLRHAPPESSRNSHRGERREVVGEAEPLDGRVVVGHTTPTATPPPHNHSDEIEGGGSGSMERMVLGGRLEQGSRNNRSSRRRNRHRRESSYDEDDQDYSSDNRRGRDDYRRDERQRKKRGQDHRLSDYMSDEDYEMERRAYSRRDRRVRDRDRDRDRDYEAEYRRDYYREDPRRVVRGSRDYYRYEEEDYSFRERSRPSSRSGSDYRRTNLDYQSRNHSRHYFNSSLAGVSVREYETNPEYFEMLRKTNPVVYAIWYQDYMRKLQDTATHSAFTQSDRASIHSGQSSGNRPQISTPSQILDSNVGNADSFDDYSPRLFSTPHVRGSYDGQGRLIVVNACSPLDGQQASVQMLSVEPEEEDSLVKDFLDSPGPFIPGVTHRSTVLQYLRKMSDQAAKGSEKLLYDLVYLIVKSNGKPDAGDISELLLESYRNSKGESRNEWDPDPSAQPINHHDMLSTFRSLLHQGNKQEALEWAMKHNGWGHALFLASKMDPRTQNRVAGEFARSLAACDPLSTLYQIMSGGIPSAATACSDRRWADWRPHLAMVLSNLTEKPATDLATVITLADGLASRGRLFAAHSCYIIAQVMFGDLYRSEGPVLLGCSDNSTIPQSQLSLEAFNYRSFLLTLCYEYAVKQGQPNFFIPALQRFKMLVAWRLVEWGRSRQALLYCELLASELLRPKADPHTSSQSDLIHLLLELSSGLKALDISSTHSALDLSVTPDPEWLQQLKQLATTLPQEEVEPMPAQPLPEQPPYTNYEPPSHVPMYRPGGNMDGGYGNLIRPDEASVSSIAEQQPAIDHPSSTSTPSKPNEVQHVSHPIQQGHPPMQPIMQPLPQPNSLPPVSTIPSYPSAGFSSQPQSFTNYEESGTTEVDHTSEGGILKPVAWESEKPSEQHPTLSSNKGTSFFHASENLLQDVDNSGKTVTKPSSAPQASSKSETQKKPDSANGSSGSSWFGGFLGKLSMKPKNQMILPDDNDPKIVFDSKLRKWVDLDNEGNNALKELKPPPMGGPPGIPMVNPGIPPGNPGNATSNPGIPLNNAGMSVPPTNMTNMYKLQKGKSMKSNYVDILSNSGSSSKVKSNMEPMLPPLTAHGDNVNPNYFVPQAVDGSDNKGPYGAPLHNDNNYQGQEQ